MAERFSRRSFLEKGGQAVAVGGIAATKKVVKLDSRIETKGVNYYEKLGVTPFINAAGTYTVLSASTMPEEVQAAVAIAAQYPVQLEELLRAAGEYLAGRLKCEAALVTAGAASALTLGTAACVTLGNKQAAVNIPTDIAGLKNEVIVQKTHRYEYDHALRNCGIRFVEVETPEQYEAAFTERTVMTNFFNAAESTKISREDWIRVAHQHGVPCFNDAAADVPPIANLWNYTQMGFDLVTFSGGKGIRGPQCTGLLLGRKDLIEAAIQNNSPNSNTVGRGMKVAKEEIVGLVAAVDWLLSQTDEALEAEFRRRAERIAGFLQNLPVETKVFIPPVANHVPHLSITYDPKRIPITGKQVLEKMREGKPRIELNPATGGGSASAGLATGENTVIVGVWMLQPGEDLIVARRLHEVLKGALQT